MSDFDYAIAGAGLSGLSLARRLVESSPSSSLCLIEPRTIYQRDHVWSFWNNALATLRPPIKKQWHKWKIRYRKRTRVCESKRYPYCAVLSEDYYDEALNQLRSAEKVSLFFGESLTELNYSSANLNLQTDKRAISARLLFDSRPPRFVEEEFRQEFYGLHIQTAKNVFDSECVTLMDFSVEKVKLGFHFYYVLPFSATEALIESVYVGLDGMSQGEHSRLLANYLKKEFGVERFEQLNVERGCIPMHSVTVKQSHPRHYAIGMRGGLVRSSTGYAFSAIHQFSDQLAQSLVKSELPEPPETLSAKARILDKVLFAYLKERPNDGPLLLSSLFEHASPDAVVRFLSDRSSLADDAAIVTAMPRKLELSAIMAKVCV
ncbi:lycopene cyclase family protein [soil metagenome]